MTAETKHPKAIPILAMAHSILRLLLVFPVSRAFITGRSFHGQPRTTCFEQFAYLFVGDRGTVMTELETDADTDMFFMPTSSPVLPPTKTLKDWSRLQSDKAMLARLATAFPPTGMAIPLPYIEDVTILHAEQTSVTLSAVVRSDDRCLTVAVPVIFPSPCTCVGDTYNEKDEQSEQHQLEECILKNLQELDRTAQSIIQHQADMEANYEAIQAHQRQAAALRSLEVVHFPTWWIHSTVDSMDVESKSLRSLLNEDEFQSSVHALAKYGIRLQLEEDYYLVLQAGIRSISPAGLILGALIRDPQDDPEQQENLASNTVVVDIPIPFTKQASDANQLRDSVLDMVEIME